MISELTAMLTRHEGVRFKPYRDTAGKLTIGVGHNLDDKPISQAAVNLILLDDIADARQDCRTRLPWFNQIDSVRQDVLVDMCFNLGINGLLGFKMFLAAMREGDWIEAARQMVDSRWAEQVGDRANELESMVLTGKYRGES